MVSKTFEKLNPVKKERLKDVLITEFSNYSLDQAQVSRIVKSAEISRGSFYTYFDDLYDAYLWTLHIVIQSVHQPHHANEIQATINFIENLSDNPYYHFLEKYFQINENLLRVYIPNKVKNHELPLLSENTTDAQTINWLTIVSTHTLMQERFTHPDHHDAIITTLHQLAQWFTQKD